MLWESAFQDLRFALRSIRRSPGFAAVAVVILALGIGATTSLFSVLHAVVLRPLPFPDPERLVRIWETNPNSADFQASAANYLDWTRDARRFSEMAAYTTELVNVTGEGEPERLQAAQSTWTLFPLLGARASLGRSFLPEEDRKGGDTSVVLLGHALWNRRFGANPDAVGRSLLLDGKHYRIIGVLSPDFAFAPRVEIWTPLAPDGIPDRDDKNLDVVARLAPDVTLAEAGAEMQAITSRLATTYPETNARWSARVGSFTDWIVGADTIAGVWILMGAVSLLLLMACTNLAHVLLGRALGRQREMGLRAALGAGRGRIVRQLLTESAVLAAGGGLAGALIASWVVDLLRRFGPRDIPRLAEVHLDPSVLGVSLAASLATALVFGLAPALHVSRLRPHETLREKSSTATIGHHRLRRALVVLQVALAMMLLAGAGLLAKSFVALQSVDPGFDPRNAVTLQILVPERLSFLERGPFLREIEARIEALPGVEAAGATNVAPLSGFRPNINFLIDGRERGGETEFLSADWRSVSPGFFRAMRIPILSGRALADFDSASTPRVALVSRSLARKYWGNADPVGTRIFWGGRRSSVVTVIGVAGDLRDVELDSERPLLYLPYPQLPWRNVTVVVRTAESPDAIASPIRREIGSFDKDLPLAEIRPLSAHLSRPLAQPRFRALALSGFAFIALALAALGIHGMMAFSVATRLRELGVRLALGARPRELGLLVLRDGVSLVLAGLALGGAGSVFLARFLESVLFGTRPFDPASYALVAGLLFGVALLSSALPARRAMRVDVASLLRME